MAKRTQQRSPQYLQSLTRARQFLNRDDLALEDVIELSHTIYAIQCSPPFRDYFCTNYEIHQILEEETREADDGNELTNIS